MTSYMHSIHKTAWKGNYRAQKRILQILQPPIPLPPPACILQPFISLPLPSPYPLCSCSSISPLLPSSCSHSVISYLLPPLLLLFFSIPSPNNSLPYPFLFFSFPSPSPSHPNSSTSRRALILQTINDNPPPPPEQRWLSLTDSTSVVLDGLYLGNGHHGHRQVVVAGGARYGGAARCHHNLLHWCNHQQLPRCPHYMEFGRWLRRGKI